MGFYLFDYGFALVVTSVKVSGNEALISSAVSLPGISSFPSNVTLMSSTGRSIVALMSSSKTMFYGS